MAAGAGGQCREDLQLHARPGQSADVGVLTDTNTTPTILKRQAWAYDAAGNRTVDQTDDAVFASTHDELNRLQARAPGGPIVFAGSLNEAGTVTIDGKPATVDGSNNFRGTAQVNAGTSTVTLMARDASGNQTTQQYEVDTSGSTTSYTYDANGNLTSDGTKTYFWNALNQLVEVKEGTTTVATFEYDGAGRRTEKVAAGLTHQYIYDAEDVAEERISGSSSDTVRYYHGAGIDEPLARKNSSDVVTYYLADHLGSIVQETSSSGSAALEREYDPWGVAMQGASTSGYAFTGREWDGEIGLYHYRARYYLPTAGKFLTDDPLSFAGGDFNLNRYVRATPLTSTDPFGLEVKVGNYKVHPMVIERLQQLNRDFFPNEDIIVTGGDRYFNLKDETVRSSTNGSIIADSAPNSSHLAGLAVDFKVTNVPDWLAEEAAKHYFDWTSSNYPKAPHVHGDLGGKGPARDRCVKPAIK
jgi:RHS repeat-associated protein